jgi:RNA polymerase sigma factor (sigma-70 family)
VSPLTLRRYRAERLLESQFKGLQAPVVANVARRLRGANVDLDACDLEACYAIAWQGLYAAVLDGQEIANPAGWLILVTFRRAVDEHRARARAHRGADRGTHGELANGIESAAAQEHDLAAELDDRARLRHLFEALRGRLSAREREAAVLCYLQGLPRAQAAARMGVSEARMRKLMEGRGPGRPGVAGKMGALVETIRDGGWCEEQGSLMRGLAFGILDPAGERYRLALMHRSQCPACRAYVTSLRGLAATMPPVLLPGGLGALALAGLGSGVRLGGAGTGAHVGRGLGGNLPASGAAGAGASTGSAAGGGWLLAGGGKLAVGCLLAVSVGTGCIALKVGADRPSAPAHEHRARASSPGRSAAPRWSSRASHDYAAARLGPPTPAAVRAEAPSTAQLTPARRVTREFGPERASVIGAAHSPTALATRPASTGADASPSRSVFPASTARASAVIGSTASVGGTSSAGAAQANREFSPG